VVYVPAPDDPGRFIEREIQAGHSAGDAVEVVSGVNAGDSVVSEGSFFIRSEVERLGLRGAADRAAMTRRPTRQGSSATPDVQTAKVVVGEEGYQPARITLRRGVPARITFLRTTDRTCGTEVVFPVLDIRRALPLNQPVTIELTPARTEEIAFACGMNMLHGAVVVR
jgi:Cu+-exporting ATPase